MHLIDKIIELTQQKIPFACIHIYENNLPQLSLGMCTVITHEDIFSVIDDDNISGSLAQAARDILEENHSCQLSVYRKKELILKAFVEVFPQPQRLVILGAGHIAQPLCDLAKIMNFDIYVVDDRPDYANSQRFPQAKVIVGEFAEVLNDFSSSPHTYFVLITRGHTFDSACLKILVNKPYAYIGMVGSLRRLQGVFKLMERQGYSKSILDKIHAPIGLPLGGDSPQDIALSIMAEIVSVRNRGPLWAQNLKEEFRGLKKSQVSKKTLHWDE
ncbi:XdhC family protein [Candidatus Uabimicrobium amorphum]|uniref:Sulfurylase large subunit, molybdopterincytosine dinucleotide biosynthesis n=1 Tax=Uabimicrobium amorphum TaxID=2596890 RepID=A0A5S9IRD6_UABAM|nr:XdhC family protein [Candidatus Uabimicrobium amorphum]BBM86723.1 sulfurylase large subunit, molybdopterincytosine dinucleotide biosynthesis [Candidatus Uabimicrobium amorphum]